jgi:predicted outer membrane repeat protein
MLLKVKDTNCQMEFIKSKFEENTSEVAGGAIHWTTIMPIIDSETEFYSNSVN